MTRLRSPLKQRGPHAIRWERWHRQSRLAVIHRCQYRCEGCGDNMKPLEWAHLVGRNNKGIGEPWCSLPELTAGLCSSGYKAEQWPSVRITPVIGCHQKIDRALDADLLMHLRQKALIALMLRFGGSHEHIGYSNPLDGIRAVVRNLEETGWEWDGTAIVLQL